MNYTIINSLFSPAISMSEVMKKLIVVFKKMLSIFLVAAIFFNGFIPKSSEFKSNFKEAIKCAVETQTNFLDKYADSVVSVTNGIAGNVLNALNVAGLCEQKISKEKEQTATNSKQDRKTEPINTSTESGIIIESNTNNVNAVKLLKSKTEGLSYTQVNNKQLQYYSEEIISSRSLSNDIGILFFILFGILVVRIKDTIAVLYNNRNIVINRLG